MPMIIELDPKKVPLTEFMKALGYDSPVAADGVLRTYNAPYASLQWLLTLKQTFGAIQNQAPEVESMTLLMK